MAMSEVYHQEGPINHNVYFRAGYHHVTIGFEYGPENNDINIRIIFKAPVMIDLNVVPRRHCCVT